MGEIRSFFALAALTVLPVLIFAMLAAAQFAGTGPAAPVGVSAAPEVTAAETEQPEAEIPAAEGEAPASEAMAAQSRDARQRVTLLRGSEGEVLSMEDYLVGVLAGEMPASFHPEALKAQAVAARTDTWYRMAARVHPAGACCDDPACCKAYLSPEELRSRWGDDWEANRAKLRRAVAETDGLIATWEGEAIFAAFHAASPGSTENSEDV